MDPVQQSERIDSLDTLRGFSLLGILLLNILDFGLPFAAYTNPTVAGGAEGANFTTWLTAMTLWDGKFRCLFSMLFGASAFLILQRAGPKIYYRRTLLLIAIGLFHAHFIWYGDILYHYGVIGLLLYPLRKLPAKPLIAIGALILGIHSLQGFLEGRGIAELSQKVAQSSASPEAIREWNDLKSIYSPAESDVEKEIQTHRSGWVDNFSHRSGIATVLEFTMFFQILFVDVLGMLILGMGLAKAGVFNASHSVRFYTAMALAGFGLGIPLNYWAATRWADSGYTIPAYFSLLRSTSDPGRLAVALGYVGLVMLACKAGLTSFTRPLAAVGRMALSNYLLTSILCTLFFNGYGAGYFAKLERHQLYFVVLAMWAINLIISPIWLRHFLYGPAEWTWRSLTYWRRQPMRRAAIMESSI